MIEVIQSGDPRWNEWLDRTEDDIYHRRGYHRFHELTGGGSARLVVIQRGSQALLWPYLERPVSQVPELPDVTAIDADSVYGYAGPLYVGKEPTESFLASAWRSLEAHWRDLGVISVFTRFHPLLGNHVLAHRFPGAGASGVHLLGETVSMDLRLPEEEAVREYKRDVRRGIAAAKRAGMTTHVDPEWREIQAFTEIYRATMLRNRAEQRFFFSFENFRQLKEELGSELHLVITEVDGEPASATVVTEHRGIVQLHLGGRRDHMSAHSPDKVEMDYIRQWASARGNRVLHLGGGRGSQADSLFFFKSRFSPRRHPFYVGRWVIDPVAYEELTSIRRSQAQMAGMEIDERFFPLYRARLRQIGTEGSGLGGA